MFAAQLPAITSDVIDSLFAIAIGFAVGGLCSSGYRLFGMHFPSFKLLEAGPMPARFAAVPLLIFSRALPHHAQYIARAPHRASPPPNSSWWPLSSPGCGA